MRNYIKSILVLYSGISLIACKSSDNEKLVSIKDKNGYLISEINYLNDTIENGTAKYYYNGSKNIVCDQIEYKLGKKNGWHIHNRPNGILESKIMFKNGVQDGETYWYFANGAIKEKSFWMNGKPYGLSTWYYENGKIRLLNITDFFGNTIFVIQYDIFGNQTNEEGVVFSPKFIAYYVNDSNRTPIENNQILINKIVEINTTVSEIPNCITEFYMGELNDSNLNFLKIQNSMAVFKTKFDKLGKHILISTGKIVNQDGVVIRNDSIETEINVVENIKLAP